MSDNVPCYISVSGVPIYADPSQFQGYWGTARDISARKHAEAALRASEGRFRTVLEALAEAVIVRDAGGRIVDCNTSAERLFGRTLSQMKGSTSVGSEWQMLREDGSIMKVEERPSVAARRTGLPQSGVVVRYRKPKDCEIWALINIQPLFEESTTTPSGFVSTITDITKLKRGEMEIVKLNVELENRVQRRTTQLKATNEELEAFSYSVAHDLRAPLSTIDGYCSLLQKALPTELGGNASRYMGRIREGVRHMGQLTDGLLSLAHLSRACLTRETVHMSLEASQIIAKLAEAEPGRRLQAIVEPDLLVNADKALLRQLLENLIANAWKFTSKKPHAEISIGKTTGAAEPSVYFVRDNGAGFDMAYADKLFGVFQRLHSQAEFAGSGIGLATVKRIVVRHCGRIWADAAVGEGSTFYFTLSGGPRDTALGVRPDDHGLDGAPGPFTHPPLLSRSTLDAPAGTVASAALSKNSDAFSVGNQQFGNAFEHAAIGMAVIGIDWRWLRVNSAFCQLLGYSEAEVFSRSFQEITHADDIGEDIQNLKKAIAGEIETYQREKRYIHKSGRTIWAYLTCSLVRDSDRRPLHFISQIQDISERKQIEQILREKEELFRTLTALSFGGSGRSI